MTISSEVRKAGPYPGNGVADTFPFDFKIFEPEDLLVVLTIDGAEQDLEFGDDYGVSLNSDQENSPGGEVVLNTPLPIGQLLTMTSAAKNLQPTKITNQGAFYPEVVNQALDRLTILVQQVDEKASRSVKVPISSTVTPDDLIAQLNNDASVAREAAHNAGLSEAAAAESERKAGLSESAAAQSEHNAGLSESAAAQSEHNAGLSESAAAQSEHNAGLSEAAAAESERQAEVSAGLAQSYVELISGMTGLIKADRASPCLVKTAASEISIKAGTIAFLSEAQISFPTQTAVSMPAVLIPGEDYAVFVHPDGTASAVADPYFDPAEAPVPGALKIGGFHYGLEAPGLTLAAGGFATSGAGHIWTQADVDEIAGINAWSIWDLQFRPGCDPRGMFLATPDVFVDIYLLNDQHIANGTSRYNTAIASGTVPPVKPLMFGGNGAAKYGSLTWFEAWEIMQSHGKRLLTYDEFAASAYGVTENQSLGGASSTPPATLRQAGFTSKGGGQQFTGHVWVWGANAHGVGGTGWVAGAGRGQTYGTPYAALFGGSRADAAFSGSRASNWDNAPWNSDWNIGARAACDRLRLQ